MAPSQVQGPPKVHLFDRPHSAWELDGEHVGCTLALLRRVDGVVREGQVANVVRDALKPGEGDRTVLAEYASEAPLASIVVALRRQLSWLDKRAAVGRPSPPLPSSELPNPDEAARAGAVPGTPP